MAGRRPILDEIFFELHPYKKFHLLNLVKGREFHELQLEFQNDDLIRRWLHNDVKLHIKLSPDNLNEFRNYVLYSNGIQGLRDQAYYVMSGHTALAIYLRTQQIIPFVDVGRLTDDDYEVLVRDIFEDANFDQNIANNFSIICKSKTYRLTNKLINENQRLFLFDEGHNLAPLKRATRHLLTLAPLLLARRRGNHQQAVGLPDENMLRENVAAPGAPPPARRRNNHQQAGGPPAENMPRENVAAPGAPPPARRRNNHQQAGGPPAENMPRENVAAPGAPPPARRRDDHQQAGGPPAENMPRENVAAPAAPPPAQPQGNPPRPGGAAANRHSNIQLNVNHVEQIFFNLYF